MPSTDHFSLRLLAKFGWGCVLGLLVVGCGSSRSADAYGVEAEVYAQEWASAWSSGDPYDTVAFYAADVAVTIAQNDLELTLSAGTWDSPTQGDGRTWLANWLERQTMPRDRVVGGTFVDDSSAAVLVTIDDLDTAAWYVWEFVDGAISEQITLRWRDASKAAGPPDRRLSAIDGLIQRYLAAWERADQELLGDLYAPDAQFTSAVASARGHDSLTESDDLLLPGARIKQIAPGTRTGPAVFVGRVDRGEPAAFIVDFTDGAGCSQQWAISITVVDGFVTTERRMPSPETVRRCIPSHADSGGWWVGLDPPEPIETSQTGLLANYDGSPIVIFNGTDELEDLLAWGLGRFGVAGLEPPRLGSATFGPVPLCDGRAGAVLENADGPPDLVHCTDAYAACDPGPSDCLSFVLPARFGLLHELAHVWLIQNVADASRAEFTAAYGLAGWDDRDAAWHQRGVENAAEMLVWGLIDVPVALVRISDPPCRDIVDGWDLLTGVVPPTPCE